MSRSGRPGRFWTYSREGWSPDHRWRPYRGGDEWGRNTVVLPIPFGGYLVIAYRTCKCLDCDEMREQTATLEREHREHDASAGGCNCPPEVNCYYDSPFHLAGKAK